MSKIALLALVAASALGAGVSAASASEPSVGYWDGGTACKANGKPIPDCVRVFSPVFQASDSFTNGGVNTTVIACPANRPFPWARVGQGRGFDSKYRVTSEDLNGMFSDFDADVVNVVAGDGLLGIRGAVAIRTELERMAADVQLAIGCSSVGV